MPNSNYDNTPTSRLEEDMRAIIDGTPFPERPAKSKMEELLEELNDLIKAGGGGGGTSTIAWKPTVAADGTISWVRTASETKPEDQNIKGPDGDPGLGIKLVSINQNGHLIITFDDDTTQDAGAIPGGGGTVDSVNGKTGAVTLDAECESIINDKTFEYGMIKLMDENLDCVEGKMELINRRQPEPEPVEPEEPVEE